MTVNPLRALRHARQARALHDNLEWLGNRRRQHYDLRAAAAAGLTPDHLRRLLDSPTSTNAALRADALFELLTHRVRPDTALAALDAGCPPHWLTRHPPDSGAPANDRVIAAATQAAATTRPKGGGDWTRLLATCTALDTHGALTPARAAAWTAVSHSEFLRWTHAARDTADPAAWLDHALTWSAAGATVQDARRWHALLPGHPDRPGPDDLAVMAGLKALAAPPADTFDPADWEVVSPPCQTHSSAGRRAR